MSGFFISVTPDEADTSELGPSSGVDGLDLGTDESELGWDDQPRTQSAKVGDET
jgi:hypothetical protein